MKKLISIMSGIALMLGPLTAHAAFAQTKPTSHDHHLRDKYGSVQVSHATITLLNGSTITATKNGITYTITTDSNTAFFRRYFGKTTIRQLAIGDLINARGTKTTATTVTANFVRDISIQERNDRFNGTVTQLISNGFIFQSKKRGSITVTTNSSTKITDKNGTIIPFSSIVVNDHLHIDGLWDHTQKTIVATVIKDNSR